MPDSVLRAIIATAPPGSRAHLMSLADPLVAAELRGLVVRPGAIRRHRVERASELIELVNDPDLLGGIYRSDTRKTVREAVAEHRLYRQIPHLYRCPACSAPPPEPAASAWELLVALGDSDSAACLRPYAQLYAGLPQDERDVLVPLLLDQQHAFVVALLVAAAAGRLPGGVAQFDLSNHLSSWLTQGLRQALYAEQQPTAELIQLAVVGGVLPTQWSYTLAHRDLLLECGIAARRVLLLVEHSDRQLLALYSRLDTQAKVVALSQASEQATVQRMLLALGQDPTWCSSQHSARYEGYAIEVLNRFPELDGASRHELLRALDYDNIIIFAEGGLGVNPEPAEVVALVRSAAEHQASSLSDMVRWLGYRQLAGRLRPSLTELIEELLLTAPARDLLLTEKALGQLAHERLWAALPRVDQQSVALSLLPDWPGTLPELAASARALAA